MIASTVHRESRGAAGVGPACALWREHRFGAAAFFALLVPLALTLTLYAWNAILNLRYERNAAQFAMLAAEGKQALLHRMESYEGAFSGGARLFLDSEYASRDQWRRYASLTVYDGAQTPPQLIYSGKRGAVHVDPRFSVRDTLQVAGLKWVLVWKSTPAFEARSAGYEPLLVLAGGLVLTGSFAAFLLVIARRTQTVQQLVQERTRQLQQSEEALRSSEETFRAAMEHASIGMALVDPTGRFLRVNQALCDLLGYSAIELGGLDFQSITYPDDLDADLGYVKETLDGLRQGYQMEKRYFHKDGRIIWTLLNVSLLRASDGTPQYFVAQIQDITQRRQMDRMKSEFISTVSHELRTPLTSIRGALGLIVSGALGPLTKQVESMLRIAHTNGERLVRIINDILDIEKIESGRLELSMRRVLLAPFLKQALEANEPYGAKFNVCFVLQPVAEGAEVLADHDRLMQIMANLMSNAAKFSPVGGQVLVRTVESDAHVRIEVEDRGTGIPEEFRPRIFEKFAQADASSSRRVEGTGLGLSITRQLVGGMGGSIGFTTEIGQGTTFYFELRRPTGGAPLADLAGAAMMRFSGLRQGQKRADADDRAQPSGR
jgi:PAS domain S-box-containing protein